LSEIGFILQGRKSIFVISTIVFIGTFQMMIVYFIIIGDILSSFPKEFLKDSGTFVQSRVVYIVLIALSLSPLIFKREIKELKIVSMLLFVAIFLFIIVFTFQLISSGTD
jgi:amino acid permease